MNLGEASARITLDISDLLAKSGQAQGALTSLDGAVGKTGSGFQKFQDGMAGLGASMLPVIGIGLNFAMNMEQAMADVNASLGGVDTAVLENLEQGFLDIGAASQFSAVEVAAVGDEIARAGFDTDKIIGMTQAVVDLTQATGTDLMTAVSGVTAVMQIWSPAIVDADIALTDAARAADIFTVAANASSADVQDIIAGMRNFGPTAASIGIGFDEASAAIAMFTNYGLKAADSGVSLTRAIENLQNPTAEAQAVMDEFGITIFDMQGNFIGLPALFDQLNASFADMTPEARNAALSVLFGAEALDVMTIAAMTGGDPIRAITGEMEASGQAAEQSALRMNTLKAQLGELFESATNLAGRLVGGLMPGLRGLVDLGNMAVDALSRLPQSLINITGVVMGVVAAFGALRTASGVLATLNRFTGGALGSFGLRAMIAPFLLMTAVIGGAYLAIRSNFLGIGDAVDRVAGRLRFLYNVFDNLRESGVDPINAGFVALGRAFPSLANGTQALARMWNRLSLAAQEVASRVDMLGEHFRYFTRLGVDPVNAALLSVGRVFPDLADEMQATQRVVNDLTASWRDFRDQGVGPVSAAFLALGTVFPAVQTAMQGLAGVTENLGDAFLAAVQGDWSQALEEVGMAARGAWVVIQDLGSALGTVAVNIGNWVLDTAVPNIWTWIQDTAIPAMGTAAVAVGDVLVQIGGWIVDTAASVWDAVRRWAIGETGGVLSLPSIAVTVAGWVLSGASNIWDALRSWAIGDTGGVLSLPNIAVTVAGWIVTGAASVWDAILAWALGETGGVLSLPSIAVTVGGWVVSGTESVVAAIESAIGTVAVTVQSAVLNILAFEPVLPAGIDQQIANDIGSITVSLSELLVEISPDAVSITTDLAAVIGAAVTAAAVGIAVLPALAVSVPIVVGIAGITMAVLGGVAIAGFLERWARENPVDAVEVLVNIAIALGEITDDLPSASELIEWVLNKIVPGSGSLVVNIPVDINLGGSGDEGPVLDEGSWKDTQDDATADQDWEDLGFNMAQSMATGLSNGLANVGATVSAAMSGALAAVGSTITSAAAGWAAALAAPLTVTVTADTAQATTALGQTTGAMAALNGQTSTVMVEGDNSGALSAIATAGAAIGGIAGMSAMTFVNGDNSGALGAVAGAAGAMAAFDGTTATGIINAENYVDAAVAAARAALMSIDGMTATTYINTITSSGATIGQALATGGYVRSRYQLVGEKGPEIVSLPYGSYVYPTGTGPQAGGGSTTIHVHVERAYGIDDLAGQVFTIGLPVVADELRQQRTATGVR